MSKRSTPIDLPDGRLHALREVWFIAWPTVLTMTSYTLMQFMDGLMVAQVDPLAVAAQGNGGIWSFTPIAFAFGFLTVVNTYVSQNLGAKTPENGPKYAWASFWFSLVMWLVVLLPFGLCLPWLFGHMHDPATIENRCVDGHFVHVPGQESAFWISFSADKDRSGIGELAAGVLLERRHNLGAEKFLE